MSGCRDNDRSQKKEIITYYSNFLIVTKKGISVKKKKKKKKKKNSYFGVDYVNEALPSLQRSSSFVRYPVLGSYDEPLIPFSLHFLWAVNPSSPKGISKEDQDSFKILKSITLSGKASWKYYLWTNREDLISESTEGMRNSGLVVREFSELKKYKKYGNWIRMAIDNSWFGMATDLLKVIILLQEGGFVADLDYRMLSSPESMHLRAHSYFGYDAWEAINNGQYAACADHPVLNTLLDILTSNIGYHLSNTTSIPYLTQPLSCADTDIFGTAVLPLSLAVFMKVNTPGYQDVLLPSCMLHAGDFENLYGLPRCTYRLRGGPNSTDLLQPSLGWQELLGSWTRFCLGEVVDIRNPISPILDSGRDAWKGGQWHSHNESSTERCFFDKCTIIFSVLVLLWLLVAHCLPRFKKRKPLCDYPV